MSKSANQRRRDCPGRTFSDAVQRKDRSEPRALRFLLHNPKNSEPAAEKAKTHAQPIRATEITFDIGDKATRRFARASFERLKCRLIDRERLR